MTTDEVITLLDQGGVPPEMLGTFPRRMEPSGEHPGNKVFRVPVATADGRFMAVSFSFGQPDDDEALNWAPVWHCVDGPFTREQLEVTPPRRSRHARRRHGADGAVWRRISKAVVSRDYGICWICGHAGANEADHVIAVTERPDLSLDAANLKAAHGYPVECPVCTPAAIARGGKPVYCNELKGGMSVERARRLIQERTALGLGYQGPAAEAQGELDWLAALAGGLPAVAVVLDAALGPGVRAVLACCPAAELFGVRHRQLSFPCDFLVHAIAFSLVRWPA
jgi:hypothetical protein